VCPHNSPKGFGVLVTDREGFIKAILTSDERLRRILSIFWPKTISNKDLLERCGTESMATILMRRYWRWIGHVTSQEASIAKTALHTRGKAKGGGRPKITWRRIVEKEMQRMGKTWSSISVMAKDRQTWRDHAAALHATRRNGHEWV